jgi:DNA-directed RNA polymerase subunit RPC12/RpoP
MLIRGVAAARAGDTAEAQRYLQRVLYLDGSHEQVAQAHLWLSRITGDTARRREHLEHVLAIDPTHGEARRELAIIDGKLQPDDIVDPDHLPEQEDAEEGEPAPKPVTARRFTCPQCGGRMGYEPGKSQVTCQYCGHRQPMLAALQTQAPVEEHDFIVALATKKGHVIPEGAGVFRCKGCQATLVTARELSAHCPYCGSAHVVEEEAPELVAPEGVIPFAVDSKAATRSFRAWIDRELGDRPVRTTRVRGLYLPLWTFDIMGEVRWRGYERANQSGSAGLQLAFGQSAGGAPEGGRIAHEGSHYVLLDDVVVPATHKVPYALRAVFERFDLSQARPYDPDYLADWPTAVYEIAVGDASLVARRQALQGAQREIQIEAEIHAPNAQQVQSFPRNLAVQSYKLLLAPIWIANYRHEATTYTVVVNGQTGEAFGEEPPGRLRQFLGRLLGEGG